MNISGSLAAGVPGCATVSGAQVCDTYESVFSGNGRNTFRGPFQSRFDLALMKRTRLRENVNLDFRADAFNATNTPHFSNPNGNVSNLVLNGDGTIKSLGGYTTITSTIGGFGREGIDQRQLQVGLKIRF